MMCRRDFLQAVHAASQDYNGRMNLWNEKPDIFHMFLAFAMHQMRKGCAHLRLGQKRITA
jgi:hypothetical protein